MISQFLLIDADDTLWENNIYFERAFEEFVAFLDHSALTPQQVRSVLDEIEEANNRIHGYGTLNFARNLQQCYRHLPPFEPLRADYGFMQSVLDPYINSMHIALLRQRRPSEEAREWFSHLRERLLREGPRGFSNKEKMALLLDAESMIWLHRELWSCPSGALAEWWRLAMRQYNVLTATPTTALYR